jgi:hypothetical protein
MMLANARAIRAPGKEYEHQPKVGRPASGALPRVCGGVALGKRAQHQKNERGMSGHAHPAFLTG